MADMNSNSPAQRGASTSRPLRSRAKRRWLPYAGAVALILLIVAGLWPRPNPVETARAVTGHLRVTVNEEGKTRIRHRYLVTAPVTGQLRRIDLDPGDEVRRGSVPLAMIDPLAPALLDARSRTQAEARRDAAQANLEKAGMAHRFAANERQRFEQLYAEKAVSVQELEPIQWREAAALRDLTAAESAFRQAEAELAQFAPGGAAEICREPTAIESPANGRVLRVFEENARVVTGGTPLLEVGDPADLEAVVEVLSRDGAAIGPGARVELEQWGGGPPLQGRVRLVEPAAFTKVSALGVEEQRVNVIVDILTPAEQRRALGDNFRVEARIVLWESERALKAPTGALFRRGNEWAAFVLEQGRARLRTLRVGRTNGVETEIQEGLKEGETVILYPGDGVRDGIRVKEVRIAP